MQFLLSKFCFSLLNRAMPPLIVGCIAGLIFGAVDVALMLPMSFPDKRTALTAAFLSRFGIGVVIPLVNLPTWPGWLVGVVFGVLLSLPDAVVTSVRPSGLKEICAGSASSALSAWVEPSSEVRPPATSVNPLMLGVPPLFSA